MQKTVTISISLRGGQSHAPGPPLLPIGTTTFHLLEAFLPFAAPPVAGVLFGLPLPPLAGAGPSLAAFDPVGALAASCLGTLVPELVVFAVRRVLVRFS